MTGRGTSNSNERGSAESRRRRRLWLLETYRADVDVVVQRTEPFQGGTIHYGEVVPACRCYRCGVLLTLETVTVDRIVPGCQGGTYRRNNIRPACGHCNSSTGSYLRRGLQGRGVREYGVLPSGGEKLRNRV